MVVFKYSIVRQLKIDKVNKFQHYKSAHFTCDQALWSLSQVIASYVNCSWICLDKGPSKQLFTNNAIELKENQLNRLLAFCVSIKYLFTYVCELEEKKQTKNVFWYATLNRKLLNPIRLCSNLSPPPLVSGHIEKIRRFIPPLWPP